MQRISIPNAPETRVGIVASFAAAPAPRGARVRGSVTQMSAQRSVLMKNSPCLLRQMEKGDIHSCGDMFCAVQPRRSDMLEMKEKQVRQVDDNHIGLLRFPLQPHMSCHAAQMFSS